MSEPQQLVLPADPTAGLPAPSRGAAAARLRSFLPGAGRRYAERRNFDLGPGNRENVSLLSPHLRHRLIREEEVAETVLGYHSAAAAEKFLQEVLWRTYWKGWLEMRPAVWARYRQDVAALADELDRDAALFERWNAAVSGRTGIACFDAWVRELLSLGYLHNHARMWFASIWIFTLKLPWPLGADLFLRHLLDGDPASNTLSWRWVAGLQTPGKTYLARADNIARYTAGRFADTPGLATSAVPLEEARPEPPQPLPPAGRLNGDEAVALLVTEEDCDPVSLGIPPGRVQAAAGLTRTRGRSPLPAGPGPAAFSVRAVGDALERVRTWCGCSTVAVSGQVRLDAMVDWARSTGVRHVVTAWAPAGPTAEWLAQYHDRLAEHNIDLTMIRRSWDEGLWPHATKGFFAFKHQYPQTLKGLGIVD